MIFSWKTITSAIFIELHVNGFEIFQFKNFKWRFKFFVIKIQ